LGRYRTGERLFPWLYTVSLNVIRNHIRRAKVREKETVGTGAPEQTDPRSDPSADTIGREQGRRLQGYLLRLPVPVREALILRFYEGMGFEDIASMTGDTISSAKMKVYRGLEKIRMMMEADGFVAPE